MCGSTAATGHGIAHGSNRGSRRAAAARRVDWVAVMTMSAVAGAALWKVEAGAPMQSGMASQLMMAGSKAFQTSLSTLWRGSDDLRFKTTYAGGTVLDGFICSDLIDIGGYSSLAPFGCITETSGVLDGAGIAGFGPAPRDSHDAPPPLPPLFLSLANVSGDHGKIGTPVPRPRFAFLTGNTTAELQLGGIDPAAIAAPLVSVPSLDAHTYSVPVSGMSVGGKDILQFGQSSGDGAMIPGILDSGTTCICLPDSTRGGQLAASPWQEMQKLVDVEAPLEIVVDSVTVSIPADVWKNGVRHVDGCLSRNCPEDRIVLGDWIFQAWAVVFEWFPPPARPGISLAPRNAAYVLKDADGANDLKTTSVTGGVRRHGVVKRVPLMDDERLTFLVPVRIGRPPQPFNLVFDTGSSFFGVKTVRPSHNKMPKELRIRTKEDARAALQKKSRAQRKEDIADKTGFHLSMAMARHNKNNGPPWWAGLVVALIGLSFFGIALGMMIVRRRHSRGAGKPAGSFVVGARIT